MSKRTYTIVRHGRKIEVDEVTRDDKAAGSKEDRHFGCPISWLLRVLPVVKSKKQLVVAIYVFRQHIVSGCYETFEMPNGGLKRLGISRWVKYRTLGMLAAAGVITMKQTGKGTFSVMILPEKPKKRRHCRPSALVGQNGLIA
jgi:hypothetical protein